MPSNNLKLFATILAMYARKNLASLPRGSLMIRCVGDDAVVVGVFGNDDYAGDARARREVELLRAWLKGTAAEELGFGLSQDGYSWALVVRADDPRYLTAVGRAFQMEMFRAGLDDAVQGAWRTACGLPAAAPSLAEQCPQAG